MEIIIYLFNGLDDRLIALENMTKDTYGNYYLHMEIIIYI
jgi:hypothetical protein